MGGSRIGRIAEKENVPDVSKTPEEELAEGAGKIEEGASAVELAKKILSGDSKKKKPKLDLFEGEEEENQEEDSPENAADRDSGKDSDDSELDRIFSEEEDEDEDNRK